MFKKLMAKFGKTLVAAFAVVGAFLTFDSNAHAAADPALTNALASSSEIVTDNLSGILGYIITVWGKGFLIGLLLAVLSLTAAIVIGAIFRRKRGKK